MKHKLVKALGIISIILLFCTLLCGYWIGVHPYGNMKFHAVFSAVSICFAIITQLIFMFKCRFCNKHK